VVADERKSEVLQESAEEKEFSLKDLQAVGSLEGAVELAISRRVDDFLWKGIADWNKWFTRLFKVGLADLALDWDTTREIIERRHLLVHNAGRVSRRYLDAVPGAREQYSLGDNLSVDESYVETAIDQLTVLGVLLPIQAWVSLFKDEQGDAASNLSLIVYDFVLSARWPIVKALCPFGREIASDQQGRWVFQCNEWLAGKRMEGLDAIRTEVASWDTSGASLTFTLVRWSLLDEPERALEELPIAIRAGALTREEAYEWPILADVREHPGFTEVMKGIRAEEGGRNRGLDWVMAGNGGHSFHRPKCRHRPSPSRRVRREEAYKSGLRPCKVCEP
jgi:hypothetical protein